MVSGCIVRYTSFSTWNAGDAGTVSERNSATSTWRITGPPKKTGSR